MSFLTKRADGLAKLAENHRKLEGVCIKFGLTPKSGDLYTLESWPIPVDEAGEDFQYWPHSREDAILLTLPGKFPEHVAAVKVHADGFYGHVLGAGGNHDLNAQELGWLLEKVTPAVVV